MRLLRGISELQELIKNHQEYLHSTVKYNYYLDKYTQDICLIKHHNSSSARCFT
uniref:Uncharacterized protein n=1 Tax=Anguilla anguilla TaxID=7936 RepID=A0A0E9V1C1_ANGAN